jgi:hypothetical protein
MTKISEAECKELGSQYGHTWGYTGAFHQYSPGCFNHGTSFYFNTHATGSAGSPGPLWCKGKRAELVTEAGNGAAAEISFVSGTAGSFARFPGVLFRDFTVCSVSRYTGGERNQILATSTESWFHGHNRGSAGVARYRKFETTRPAASTATDWVVICGQNGGDKTIEVNGNSVIVAPRIAEGTDDLDEAKDMTINGVLEGLESDFGLYELMLWNRPLYAEEREAVTTMLLGRLVGGDAVGTVCARCLPGYYSLAGGACTPWVVCAAGERRVQPTPHICWGVCVL